MDWILISRYIPIEGGAISLEISWHGCVKNRLPQIMQRLKKTSFQSFFPCWKTPLPSPSFNLASMTTMMSPVVSGWWRLMKKRACRNSPWCAWISSESEMGHRFPVTAERRDGSWNLGVMEVVWRDNLKRKPWVFTVRYMEVSRDFFHVNQSNEGIVISNVFFLHFLYLRFTKFRRKSRSRNEEAWWNVADLMKKSSQSENGRSEATFP